MESSKLHPLHSYIATSDPSILAFQLWTTLSIIDHQTPSRFTRLHKKSLDSLKCHWPMARTVDAHGWWKQKSNLGLRDEPRLVGWACWKNHGWWPKSGRPVGILKKIAVNVDGIFALSSLVGMCRTVSFTEQSCMVLLRSDETFTYLDTNDPLLQLWLQAMNFSGRRGCGMHLFTNVHPGLKALRL